MGHPILIVDDEATFARNLETYLSRHGYEVCRVETAEDGLEQLVTFRPAVVLLDFNLPGINGLQMLAEMRERESHVKVIVITGQGSEQIAVDAMKAGAYDYLTKPVALGKLKIILEKMLGQERLEEGTGVLPQQGRGRQRRRQPAGRVGADARGQGNDPAHRRRGRRADRCPAADGADHRRDRHRQGTGGARAALQRPARRAPLHRGQLRRHPREPGRGGAVRLRARRFHRRQVVEGRADRGRRSRHPVPRRDRRHRRCPSRPRSSRRSRTRRCARGRPRERRVDVHIVAATNSELGTMVRGGQFREDLFYRLQVAPLHIPPLRERGEDVVVLANISSTSSRIAIASPTCTSARRRWKLCSATDGQATCANCATSSSKR